MANPALNEKRFDQVRKEETQAGWAAPATRSRHAPPADPPAPGPLPP